MNIMYRIYYKNKDELEAQLLDFKILFAYHSNKIENQNTDYHPAGCGYPFRLPACDCSD